MRSGFCSSPGTEHESDKGENVLLKGVSFFTWLKISTSVSSSVDDMKWEMNHCNPDPLPQCNSNMCSSCINTKSCPNNQYEEDRSLSAI